MRDEARDEKCAQLGWTVRRYGTDDIRLRPAGIADEVERLRRRAAAAWARPLGGGGASSANLCEFALWRSKMQEVTLVADVGRSVGKSAARKIRREGKVPAIVYGQGTDPEAVAVPSRELQHILHGAGGSNTLINLELNGRNDLVLARQVVRHPVRHTLIHVDFIRVRRDQAVAAEVPIHLTGEPQGVKDGGLLEQATFTLSIEAKPGDLPAGIEADVSALDIGDQLSVADLKLPAGVITTQDPGDLVAHVTQPRGLDLPEEAEEAAEAEEGAEGEGEAAEAGEAPAAEAGEGASAEAE